MKGLTNDEKVLDELWESMLPADRNMSYNELGHYMVGFTNGNAWSYAKHKYIKKYFEELPKIINQGSKSSSEQFFYNGFPSWPNLQYLIDETMKA